MVNIKGLNKHHLLQLMCSKQNIVTTFWELQQIDTSELEPELKFVNYHKGVKIYIDFRDDEVNSYVYNHNAGEDNKLEKIVECMRKLMKKEIVECMRELMKKAEEAEYPEYILEKSESEEEKELEEYINDQNYQNNSHYINGQYMDNDEICDYYKSLDIWDKM